ncbi:response regulator [Janthinobacterium sp. RB2R34]|uniref:response regulator n=1 Tax=Janthinobacterium sp. RB2R34 TaxID=3424193 RepID=UPI003F299015
MDVQDASATPVSAESPDAARRTLLLVDDEQNILAALKRLLRRDDYHILTATSGQEGLDLLAGHAVDVIVSDQRMPGMLGADFLRKARLLYPQTMRIMLSGYTELQAVTDAVNEGAIFKFLTKPWDDQQLRAHIAEAFRLKGIDDDNVRLNEQLREANLALSVANDAMQALLRQQQNQISHDEVSLGIAREVLQFLPLPILGLGEDGMIAFINAAAARLFDGGAALLGCEAALVLPRLFEPYAGAQRLLVIDGKSYVVALHAMGARSRSRGSLVTLCLTGAPP